MEPERTAASRNLPSAAAAASNCDAVQEPAAAKACNTRQCVSFAWGMGAWGACSKTCGGGERHRTRTQVSAAVNGGKDCAHMDETDKCNTQWCPSDCKLASWGGWSGCSAT